MPFEKTHCVLTHDMFMELYKQNVWEPCATTTVVGGNSSVVLNETEDNYVGLASWQALDFVDSINYDDEYVRIEGATGSEIVITIKKNGIPIDLHPFVHELPGLYDWIEKVILETNVRIVCDLPELNMYSLEWLINSELCDGSVVKMKTKKINAASRRVQMQDVLKKLHGGLFADILISRDDMFSYEGEHCIIRVPDQWYFDSDDTELYTGIYKLKEEDIIVPNVLEVPDLSAFQFGPRSHEGRMLDEILGHVDNLRMILESA